MGRKIWGLKFFYSSPSTCSGAYLKANLGVARPEDISHEYPLCVDANLLDRKGC
jgi:hypothetical protein